MKSVKKGKATVASVQLHGRTYGQACGLAYALDLVGERWTLLVVRELAYGPKRFAHLLEALPGMGTNLLAKRLREMEENNVIQKILLPRPASVQAYALTELGRGLTEAIAVLQRWGLVAAPMNRRGGFALARWAAQASIGVISPAKMVGLNLRIAFDMGDDSSFLHIENGKATAHAGLPSKADVILAMTSDTYFMLASGKMTLENAKAAGKVQFQGTSASIRTVLGLYRK